jgi:hypothetical protein
MKKNYWFLEKENYSREVVINGSADFCIFADYLRTACVSKLICKFNFEN